MPRIRTIKPDCLNHRKVGKLSDRAFRVWITLITQADDEGRLVADTDQLRVLAFGYFPEVTSEEVEIAMKEIETPGLIRRYTVNGTQYACFPSWQDHQRINRPTPSKLPPVNYDSMREHGSISDTSMIPHCVLTLEGKGRERKGKEYVMFDELWMNHPGPKGSKYDARKAYGEANPPENVAALLKAQVAYKRECDAKGVFCPQLPHLHRWLKKRRWEDEIPAKEQQTRSPLPSNPKDVWQSREQYLEAKSTGRVPPYAKVEEWETTSRST